MTIEFTEQDLNKLNEFIQVTPFKYAYPLFQFFQSKIAEANKLEKKSDGNQDTGQ